MDFIAVAASRLKNGKVAYSTSSRRFLTFYLCAVASDAPSLKTLDNFGTTMLSTTMFQRISSLYDVPGVCEVIALAWDPLPARGLQAYSFHYASDGLQIAGFLVAPSGSGPWPVIIDNRGGNRHFGAITNDVIREHLSELASWGYVVLASQYRGGPGSDGQDEFGGSDLNDVLNLFPLVQQLPLADAERIGMYGESRGGMMTYLTLRHVGFLRAAATVGGLADLRRNAAERPEMRRVFQEMFPLTNEELEQRSALRWTEELCPTTPLLLLHGTADDQVSSKDSQELAAQLHALGRPCELELVAGGDHSLHTHYSEKMARVQAWFNRYLKPAGHPLSTGDRYLKSP